MYLGNMVEKCGSKELFAHNYHPYTKALLSAIPRPKLGEKPERILLKGELTSPINPKPGCRFAPRCLYAKERCFKAVSYTHLDVYKRQGFISTSVSTDDQ